MGLTVVVYENKNNIKVDLSNRVTQVDTDTGEIYSDDIDFYKSYPKETFIAIKKRLGNISAIGNIFDEIKSIIENPNSIVLNGILYSGVHSGDTIPVTQLDSLKNELHLIKERTKGKRSSLLDDFLLNMEAVLNEARKQNNPIVFV